MADLVDRMAEDGALIVPNPDQRAILDFVLRDRRALAGALRRDVQEQRAATDEAVDNSGPTSEQIAAQVLGIELERVLWAQSRPDSEHALWAVYLDDDDAPTRANLNRTADRGDWTVTS